MFWKQKRNPPRRFSICPILVDGTLRFTSLKILSQSSSTWKISKFNFQTSRRLLGGIEWFLVRWKEKRNPPRRFSICPILVDGTLRFTSSKFGGFQRNPRIGGFPAKCCRATGCQKLSKSIKYLPNTPFGTYNPNVYNCQDPFNNGCDRISSFR